MISLDHHQQSLLQTGREENRKPNVFVLFALGKFTQLFLFQSFHTAEINSAVLPGPTCACSFSGTKLSLWKTVYYSSVQDGTYALRKAHACSNPSLRSFLNIPFKTVPIFVWLRMDLLHTFKEDCCALPLFTPIFRDASHLWLLLFHLNVYLLVSKHGA